MIVGKLYGYRIIDSYFVLCGLIRNHYRRFYHSLKKTDTAFIFVFFFFRGMIFKVFALGERVTVTVNDRVSYDVVIKSIENTEDDDLELNKF